MKQNKERLFEVMGRLDKTFKPKLNENFGIESEDDTEVSSEPETGVEMPAEPETDMEVSTEEEPEEEKSIEEKYEELKEKVEELYGMINGEEPEGEGGEEEMNITTDGNVGLGGDDPTANLEVTTEPEGEEGEEEELQENKKK